MSITLETEANDNRWLILRARVYEEKIKSAFRLFRESGIEPILIKGWAAAIEYPEKYLRSFGDIDLSVNPKFYEKSKRLISSDEGKKLIIDLHCGLRHLDRLEWEDLFENSVLIDLDGEKIRILCPEDHLRVLCVHWLTDGGADKERLSDIYYLLENHKENFDWEKCFRNISSVRRQWIIKTIGAVAVYHELDLTKMPFSKDEARLPDWFSRTLEEEWASETKLVPIQLTLKNRTQLWQQLKKRFPPNAIQSTVDMEGEFDDAGRFYYQVGSMFLRLVPSVKRITHALKLYRRNTNAKD